MIELKILADEKEELGQETEAASMRAGDYGTQLEAAFDGFGSGFGFVDRNGYGFGSGNGFGSGPVWTV